MASLYILAIGGTGAKCAEAIAHVIATGIFTPQPIRNSKVKVIFIDPDESNGHIDRAKKTIQTYQACHELMNESFKDLNPDENEYDQIPWMSIPLLEKGLWSPFESGNRTLSDFLSHHNYQEKPLGQLLSALYTKAELQDNLDEGFHGRPAMGAVVFSQVDLAQASDPFWNNLITEIKQDLNSKIKPKVFLCGSIFGGAGASGFPTFARLLRNTFKNNEVKIGGLLMLPYFQFSVPPSQDPNQIFARSEDFLLKTEAALRYYQGQAEESFDTIYMLGDVELVDVKKFSRGTADQKNDPHFLELYAALAARHFWFEENDAERGKVVLIERRRSGYITWDDVPSDFGLGNHLSAQKELIAMTRFAFAWTAGVVPYLKMALNDPGVINDIHWFSLFFKPRGFGLFIDKNLPELSVEFRVLSTINNWCENFLEWLALLHYSQQSSDTIQLFRVNQFADKDGRLNKCIDNFPYLVVNPGVDNQDRQKDTFSELTMGLTRNFKNSLSSPNVGAMGLAKAIYLLCRD